MAFTAVHAGFECGLLGGEGDAPASLQPADQQTDVASPSGETGHDDAQRLYPAAVLATVGVALTAGLLVLFAHAFGLAWPEALLLGAAVSSTDAVAVFAVLHGGRLSGAPT